MTAKWYKKESVNLHGKEEFCEKRKKQGILKLDEKGK